MQLLCVFGRVQLNCCLGRGRVGPVTRANKVELSEMGMEEEASLADQCWEPG